MNPGRRLIAGVRRRRILSMRLLMDTRLRLGHLLVDWCLLAEMFDVFWFCEMGFSHCDGSIHSIRMFMLATAVFMRCLLLLWASCGSGAHWVHEWECVKAKYPLFTMVSNAPVSNRDSARVWRVGKVRKGIWILRGFSPLLSFSLAPLCHGKACSFFCGPVKIHLERVKAFLSLCCDSALAKISLSSLKKSLHSPCDPRVHLLVFRLH